ncbi:anhydro-N-acetylmuramic acid kinase [Thalassomonas actiniarum]|uniref:Anhydro-N-acetylmuramic acid kinase n=1 Tax=Thalassomonas actiniarum TaxID=485447 RepID=A0AAF0C479_9GAMM|nr:anhydro-N-acetylmuramic acid kinase [Thalassomonas actiniarum]WDD99653.1 anhydro-N-acetylmuramic acid kinase [Thalassomonas actiniarum]
MSQAKFYIGLMSGTSADGIDLALVDFNHESPRLAAKYYQAYRQDIREQIMALYVPGSNEIDRAFALDVSLGQMFADTISAFLTREKLNPKDIIAIGNHGQTIRHRPGLKDPFTLQIGCSQILATLTGIRVIGQFRRKDMALGGQGAPLVPAFHQALFPDSTQDIFVVNIGGIANITYLPGNKDKTLLGFDTGPGNALLDSWYQQHHQGRYDDDGRWGASGQVNEKLLTALLDDDHFQKTAPKSTGREHFHQNWLAQKLTSFALSASDVQASLTALTADSIANDIKALSQSGTVYLCGGGCQNSYLTRLLSARLTGFSLAQSDTLNIDSDALEAMAFAWLAFAFDKKIPGNVPAVTGACRACVLGQVFEP